ncbi:MAG: hypothetical protein ACTS78_01825 [Arsenophonus sp. NC-WZS1-MAG3]
MASANNRYGQQNDVHQQSGVERIVVRSWLRAQPKHRCLSAT